VQRTLRVRMAEYKYSVTSQWDWFHLQQC